VLAALLAAAVGCGTKVGDIASSIKDTASSVADKAGQAAKSVTQSAQDVAGKAGETVGLAGNMDLTVDAPVKVGACYTTLIVSQAGRGNVLQLQSCRDPAQEAFPSALVRAQVSVASVAELQGQTIPAQMFIQVQKDGPTWSTQKELIQLKITAVEPKAVSAEVVSGALINAASGASQPVKGVLKGVL